MPIAAVIAGQTIDPAWGNSVADAINKGDHLVPRAYVPLLGSTAPGSLTRCGLDVLTTNSVSTFGPVATNQLPILRSGIYQVTLRCHYYSASAAAAVNLVLIGALVLGGTTVSRSASWVGGHNISLQTETVIDVTTTGTIEYQHQDQAFRSLAVVTGVGSVLEVVRLGNRT